MAKIFLDKNETRLQGGIVNGDVVFGADGQEVVVVNPGVNSITFDQNIEGAAFTGRLSDYNFKQAGNILQVFSGTTLVSSIALQGDADGTQLTFSDGSVAAKYDHSADATTGAAIKIGSATVSSVTAAAVNLPASDLTASHTTESLLTTQIHTLVDGAHTTTVTTTPGDTTTTLMWEGVPVGATSILCFFQGLAGTAFAELGKDMNMISGVDAIKFAADGTSAAITLNLTDNTKIDINSIVGLDYLSFLKGMIFDANGVSRLTNVSTTAPDTTTTDTSKGAAIVLTTLENNGGTMEVGTTTAANDLIVAGRTELLHGAYIDAGGGYNTLEVDVKGVYAQPLALINIQEIHLEKLPNVYTKADGTSQYSTTDAIGSLSHATTFVNSTIDLSRAIDLQKLVITEGPDASGNPYHIEQGNLTVAGIRNGATVRLEGGFTKDVTLQYSEGLNGAVNVQLALGSTDVTDATGFHLNVAQNASVLNLESDGYENWLAGGNFGGALSKLNITGAGKLYIEEKLQGFHARETAIIDASGNTGGVHLTFVEQPAVKFIGSTGGDNFTATGSNTVTILGAGAAGVANVFNTDDSKIVHISAGASDDTITSVRGDQVTIDAGAGTNKITVSASEINIITGAGNDSITVSGMDTSENFDPAHQLDGFTPGALLNIDAGAGQNTITLGRDVGNLNVGVVALSGSVITGQNIKLFVENNADLSHASLTGVTSVVLKGELTLSAAQFQTLGSAEFTAFHGADADLSSTLHIVVTSDVTLASLIDLSHLSSNVKLAFDIAPTATLTLTAEQLVKYVAENGINVGLGLNGHVVLTDAGLNFDAFSDHLGGGSLGGTQVVFAGSDDLVIIRSVNGYDRPAPTPSVDKLTINSDVTPVIGKAITSVVTTLELKGSADLKFESTVELGKNFVIDASGLTGKLIGLDIKHFENVGQVIGNNTGTRINVELSGDVGASGLNNGLKTSGVAEYIVTNIDTESRTAVFNTCDNTKGVQVLGLQGNAGKTIEFTGVSWGAVHPTFLLEGDGHKNFDEGSKALGDPNHSSIGTLKADFFFAGAPAVVNIDNQGVQLGLTSIGEARAFLVDGIDLINAASLQVNITEGNAIITEISEATGLTSIDLNASGSLDIKAFLPCSLETIDAQGVVGAFTAGLQDIVDHSFNFHGGAAAVNLTLENVVADAHSVIDGGTGVSTLIIANANVDLAAATLISIEKIVLDDAATLTLSLAELNAVGAGNIVLDLATHHANLNITGLDSNPFVGPALEAGINLGTATLAKGAAITLDPTTDLTGVDQIIVQDGTTLKMTAHQFQELDEQGSIVGATPSAKFSVIITDLKQADIDQVGGLHLNGIVGAQHVTVQLGEQVVELATHDANHVMDSTADLNGANVVLTDNQTLVLDTLFQANGLHISGGTNTTLDFNIASIGAFQKIDASGFDVNTLKLQDIFVARHDVEFLQDLASKVHVDVYSSLTEQGHLTNHERVVTVEANTTVPGFVVFNDHQDDSQVHTLDLTLAGGSKIDGDLRLDTFGKDASLLAANFDTLTIHSNGAAVNTITGDITPFRTFGGTLDNNLLNVKVDGTQALTLGQYDALGNHVSGGAIDFNSVDANLDVAQLSLSGTASLKLHSLDTTDSDQTIKEFDIVNNGGALNVTDQAGTPALNVDNAEKVVLSGTGSMAFGTAGGIGVQGHELSTLDASALKGDLALGNVEDVDSENFAFTAGTGVTTLTLTDVLDKLQATDTGWSFDFSKAAAGSKFILDHSTFTAGNLNINLGANTTLEVAENNVVDLTHINLTLVQAKDIVLDAGAHLTLTAAEANGLHIVAAAGIVLDPHAAGYDASKVPVVDVIGLSTAATDLSHINPAIAGTVTLLPSDPQGDADVTLDAGTHLGNFTLKLETHTLADDVLSGQTVRFTTVEQAASKIHVVGDVADGGTVTDLALAADTGTNGTNVIWLFDKITGPIDTTNYDAHVGRVWFEKALLDIANNPGGNNVESLFTSLPTQVLRIDFSSLTDVNLALDKSVGVDRFIELASFVDTSATGLAFDAPARLTHIRSLTVELGGEVKTGDIKIGNLVQAPAVDPASIHFDSLTIDSYQVLKTGAFLAPQGFVNNNDGVNQIGEKVQPIQTNTVGNIGVGAQNGLDLMNVTLNTVDPDQTGANLMDSAKLNVGTITFDTEVAASMATLRVLGSQDVTVASVNATDVQIASLLLNTTGFTGVLAAPGASPALNFNNTAENLIITNGGAAAGTITLGSAAHAGVVGQELSHISATNYGGTLNLGVLAQIDSTNDDSTPLTAANDHLAAAFNFTSGTGITTATLDAVTDASVTFTPHLAAGSEWQFNYANALGHFAQNSLTITDKVVFDAGAKLTLLDVPLEIVGNVDLSQVVLNVVGSTIHVAAGDSLTLSVAQVLALNLNVTGGGTIKVTGDATDASSAALGQHLHTVGVDLSAVTLLASDLDHLLAVNLDGATDDFGHAVGQNIIGSVNPDSIVTGTLDDTLTGGADSYAVDAAGVATGLRDTLNGAAGHNTYHVDSGTDQIVGLHSNLVAAVVVADTLIVDSGATAHADGITGFTATAATVNNGIAILTGLSNADKVIDLHLAGGSHGFTLVGGTDNLVGADTLIGSAGDDILNGGNNNQNSVAAADVLTGGAGHDTFQFNIQTSTPVASSVVHTTPGVDQETATFTAGSANASDVYSIGFTLDGVIKHVDIFGSSVDFSNAGAVASAAATALSGVAGVSASAAGGVVTAAGTGIHSLTLNNLTLTGGTHPATEVSAVFANGEDVPQVDTLHVAPGLVTIGEVYHVLVTLAEGSTIGADYTAVLGDTAGTVAAGLALGIKDNVTNSAPNLIEVQAVAVTNLNGSADITFTDKIANDGGFTLTSSASPTFGGSGASNNLNTSLADLKQVDTVADFLSGTDKIGMQGLGAGTAANFAHHDAAFADFAAATAFVNTAASNPFNHTVQYFFATDTADNCGLLFFDANLDGKADGIIKLVGVDATHNVHAADIITF